MKSDSQTEAPQGVFLSTLGAMHHGQVLHDLDEAIRDVTRAVQAAAKKGKVVLSLEIIPNGTGVGDTPLVKILDKITKTEPRPDRDKDSVFYVDENCNPSRRNPYQGEMQLTTLEGSQPSDKPAPALAQGQ